MSTERSHAQVTLASRRLWSLRASLGATRWVLYLVAIVGVLATARNAIAPARARVVVTAAAPQPDPAAAWFALSFARAYLTWTSNPASHEASLAPFLGPDADPDAGLTPAAGSSERVSWLAVAGERDSVAGERDYTIAAGITGGATRYLAVAVDTASTPTLMRYPALVATPAPAPAAVLDGSGLPPVTDTALVAVLTRALTNYVGSAGENLDADLAPGARVAPIAQGLTLRAVTRLALEGADSVLATVTVSDAAGDVFTLGYEVALTQVGGRWEITRIQP
jgi:hypothetical protein